jgi:hypothetical protein
MNVDCSEDDEINVNYSELSYGVFKVNSSPSWSEEGSQ